MRKRTYKLLSWIIVFAGFGIAILCFPCLPDRIPMHFSSGVPDNFSPKSAIFLWPLVQLFVFMLGNLKAILPGELRTLLTDSQYRWGILGILLFILVLEILILTVSFHSL